MKKMVSIIVIAVFTCLVLSSDVYAANSDANRQTMFNSITDFFATLGKSDRNSTEILRERKNARRRYRINKERRRVRSTVEKRLKAHQKKVQEQIRLRNNAKWGKKKK